MLIMPLFLIFCIILQQNVPLLRRDVHFCSTTATFFLYVFPQGKSCVGIDFVDRWFVTLDKLLPLGIKHKNVLFILFCPRLFVTFFEITPARQKKH